MSKLISSSISSGNSGVFSFFRTPVFSDIWIIFLISQFIFLFSATITITQIRNDFAGYSSLYIVLYICGYRGSPLLLQSPESQSKLLCPLSYSHQNTSFSCQIQCSDRLSIFLNCLLLIHIFGI